MGQEAGLAGSQPQTGEQGRLPAQQPAQQAELAVEARTLLSSGSQSAAQL